MNIRDFFKTKERAWRSMMQGPDGALHENGKVALADLRMFCNLTKSHYSNGDVSIDRMEGRREVALRILAYLNFDYSKLYEIEEDVIDD